MKRIAERFKASKVLIIALTVVIGFSMAGCPNDEREEKLPTNYGGSLNLSGEVFEELLITGKTEFDAEVSYPKFSSELTILDIYGGSGKVKGGSLTYSIGIPTVSVPLNFEKLFNKADYGRFKPSSEEVEGVGLESLETDSEIYPKLYRGNMTISNTDNSITITDENVIYVFVNKDVTISGIGWPKGITTGITTEKVEDLDLGLKVGWNAVYERSQITINLAQDGKPDNIIETYKMTSENPSSLIWYTRAIPNE